MSPALFSCLISTGLMQSRAAISRRSAILGAGLLTASTKTFAVEPRIATSWILAGNVAFPVLSLNTAGLSADASERAFRHAISVGIKHVDFHPGIERDGVARVLATPGIDRSSLFLVSTSFFKLRSCISRKRARTSPLVHTQHTRYKSARAAFPSFACRPRRSESRQLGFRQRRRRAWCARKWRRTRAC